MKKQILNTIGLAAIAALLCVTCGDNGLDTSPKKIGDVDRFLGRNNPAKVVFKTPMSKTLIPADSLPPEIHRGIPLEVEVEVQDRYGNAVGANVPVTITSQKPTVANVSSESATTNADGIATFVANVTNGTALEQFELYATLTANGAKDTALMRVARAMNQLVVFFSDTGNGSNKWQTYFDPDVVINGVIGEWYKVTVKAVAPDSVLPGRSGAVLVVSNAQYLVFAATPGGTPATVFTMTGSVATFWVGGDPSSPYDISDCIQVTKLQTTTPDDVDYSVMQGIRCGIRFVMPTTPIVTTFKDERDGKEYKKVTIGTQTWMAENLNYEVLNNTDGSICISYYNGYYNSADSCAKYGRLYNWETAMGGTRSSSANPSGVQGVCPAGWHLPSDAEWTALTEYIGDASKAGTKLKSSTGWTSSINVQGGTNEYGWSALPGGFGSTVSVYYDDDAGNVGYWWSATEYGANNAWYRGMDYDREGVRRDYGGKSYYLYSVRCVEN